MDGNDHSICLHLWTGSRELVLKDSPPALSSKLYRTDTEASSPEAHQLQ